MDFSSKSSTGTAKGLMDRQGLAGRWRTSGAGMSAHDRTIVLSPISFLTASSSQKKANIFSQDSAPSAEIGDKRSSSVLVQRGGAAIAHRSIPKGRLQQIGGKRILHRDEFRLVAGGSRIFSATDHQTLGHWTWVISLRDLSIKRHMALMTDCSME